MKVQDALWYLPQDAAVGVDVPGGRGGLTAWENSLRRLSVTDGMWEGGCGGSRGSCFHAGLGETPLCGCLAETGDTQ